MGGIKITENRGGVKDCPNVIGIILELFKKTGGNRKGLPQRFRNHLKLLKKGGRNDFKIIKSILKKNVIKNV